MHTLGEDVVDSEPDFVQTGVFAAIARDAQRLTSAVSQAYRKEILDNPNMVLYCAVNEESGDCRIWKRIVGEKKPD